MKYFTIRFFCFLLIVFSFITILEAQTIGNSKPSINAATVLIKDQTDTSNIKIGYVSDYNGKENKIVRKENLKRPDVNPKPENTNGNFNKTSDLSSNFVLAYNPLSNINIANLDPAVFALMQKNKANGKAALEGICLVYKIETGLDANVTNEESLLKVWKKQPLFIGLKKRDKNSYELFLNAYFDTELSEEIMTQNSLKVIFKDEYYSILKTDNAH